MQTIPLMCTVCGEIVDFKIPLGEAVPGGCPMCGGEFTSDYDFPPQEHVTIEVQTPERLRIRFPSSVKPFSVADKVEILVMNAILLTPFGMLLHACFMPHRPSPVAPSRIGDFVFFAVLSIVLSPSVNLTALVNRWGHRIVEVEQDKLDIVTTLGRWSWTKKIPLTKVRNVEFEVSHAMLNLPPQETQQRFCSLELRNVHSLRIQSPDRARYITHLLRRQLYALGHELSDTSDKSAKRPGEKRSALEPVHALR